MPETTPRTLVIYYSFQGSTRRIAKAIAEALQGDLLELVPDSQPWGHGLGAYLWFGWQRIRHRLPRLAPLDKDPADYDLIFLGTPVWSWDMSLPMQAFLRQLAFMDENLALFCCCKGDPGKTLSAMEEALVGNRILGSQTFIDVPANTDLAVKEASRWAQEIAAQVEVHDT